MISQIIYMLAKDAIWLIIIDYINAKREYPKLQTHIFFFI